MEMSVCLHGPLVADHHPLDSHFGGTTGVVKVSKPDEAGGDLTIFCPSPEAAKVLADAFNVAFAPAAKLEAA
jgi:hypothetical protein